MLPLSPGEFKQYWNLNKKEHLLINMENIDKSKIKRKNYFVNLSFSVIIIFSILSVAIVFAAARYASDLDKISSFDIKVAQKIGNWEAPDGNYVVKNLENIQARNKNVGLVELKDKKSGNKIYAFQSVFSLNEIFREKEELRNEVLAKYGLENFYLTGKDKIGGYGQEINYFIGGWGSSDEGKAGIIGNIDCRKTNTSVLSVFVVALNVSGKYDSSRALGFLGTIKCPLPDEKSINGDKDSDKVDTDKDGLPDKVEKMLGSDPFKADTDGDGYSDFDEIKNGYNPMQVRSWDKYTAEELEKVKKDIKFINIDVYDKLFDGG